MAQCRATGLPPLPMARTWLDRDMARNSEVDITGFYNVGVRPYNPVSGTFAGV